MKANGSRREEEGGKNITEKIRCVPRSGEKNSRSGSGGGGGWGWRSMRGAGSGRGACAAPAERHTRRGPGLHRSSVACRPLPSRPSAAPLRRATIRSRGRDRLYMSKVFKSVLPVATARVIPQHIYEPDPSCTTLRVSTQTSLICAEAIVMYE